MKKYYFFFLACCVTSWVSAQIVNIPDANFKAKLLAADTTNTIATNSAHISIKIDANSDGEIQVTEAQQVYLLNVSNSSISDLMGISNFTNMSLLYCNSNSLTTLNLSGLAHLYSIECNFNQLTAIPLNGVPNLNSLSCSNNHLTSIDVSPITAEAFNFNCSFNNLTVVDFSARSNKLTGVNCSNNPNLTYLNCKDEVVLAPYLLKTSGSLASPPPPPGNNYVIFRNTPNLQFICADNDEIIYIQQKINTAGYNTNLNCQISSTCSFNTNATVVTASGCESYTWPLSGQTYSVSGTYPYSNGSNDYILVLTIYPLASTTAINACSSYIWSANNQTYTQSGTYTTTVTNAGGCSEVQTLQLTINQPITITAQPNTIALCKNVGSTATVSAATNVSLQNTYNWQYRVVTASVPNPAWIGITIANSSTVYSGYTSNTLTITKTSAAPALGTEYRVLVGNNNSCGNVVLTSDTASLTLQGTAVAGMISAPLRVCQNNDITFSLSGQTGDSIQWQTAPTSTGTFVDIPGATGASYTLFNAQPGTNKSYRAKVTSTLCNTTATTTAKTITIDALNVAGSITGGGIVCSGGSGTLKITGYSGLIQWEYSTDGANYLSAPKAAAIPAGLSFSTSSTTSTSTMYNVTAITGNVWFRAKVSMGYCSVLYTNAVQYTIGGSATVGTVSSALSTVCNGTGTTVNLTNTIGTISWQKSTNYTAATPTWVTIANSNVLTQATGNLVYPTAFRASVSIGSCSTVLSNTIIVGITAKPLAKTIAKSVTTPSGASTATAICTTNGTKILTIGAGYNGVIQRQASTTSTTTDFVDIPGATAQSFTITNPVSGANYFRARFTNICGASVNSAAATVYYKSCREINEGTTTVPSGIFTVNAYPNPFGAAFKLDLETVSLALVQVSVYDMMGRLVEERTIAPNQAEEQELGSQYASGVYTVMIRQQENSKMVRIIKK